MANRSQRTKTFRPISVFQRVGTASLPDRIKLERQRAQLTQQQLADKIGCDRASISQWERGGAIPHFSSIKTLAEVLGVPPERFNPF